jgi:hypothetical protein
MKTYKQKLKIRLLTALGVFNDDLLDEGNSEFDMEISRSCAKYLSDTELLAYFYLFRCVDSYEEARCKLNQCNESNYSVNTVVKYSRRAIDRIVANAHKDKRLSAWILRHKKPRAEKENN